MVRVNKAFVGLLVVYILTVVILLNVLRSSQGDSLSKVRVVDFDNGIVEQSDDSEKHDNNEDETSDDTQENLTNPGDYSEASQRYGESTTEEKPDVGTGIRYGPGENGSAVILSDDVKSFLNRTEFQRRRKFHGFDTFMSDLVSLQRKVEDQRPEACKRIKYPDNMEPASVVIIYRDEWPSVVLRTVYSVLGNSPKDLLKEIVLVDDGSKDPELKAKIAIHVANVEKLKLVQNSSPLGLMLARQKGIEATTAEYFIVMDGHMEVAPGWLEPLIARLQDVPKALLCSHVGGVDQDTFKFHVGRIFDGLFPFFDTLTLGQMWAPFSSRIKTARNGSVAPMPMGTVQGMMAVMRKDFFMQLGGFDPGMRQWGSEQMELSIKVWMCGGRVELVPCSKVAHMYRITPWGHVNTSADFLVANSLRTAEVWLDDPYKSIVRDVIGNHSTYDIGDLTDRHRIRRDNNCKPFQYFVDMVKTFSDVYLLGDIKAKGNIRSKKINKCLYCDKLKDKSYKLRTGSCNQIGNRYFILTEHDQIRSTQGTILRTKLKTKPGQPIPIEIAKSPAYKFIKEAVWQYRNDKTLYNVATASCLTVVEANALAMKECTSDVRQQWEWQRV